MRVSHSQTPVNGVIPKIPLTKEQVDEEMKKEPADRHPDTFGSLLGLALDRGKSLGQLPLELEEILKKP